MTHEFQVEALDVGLRVEVAGMSRTDFRRLCAQWRRVAGHGTPSATISAVLGERVAGANISGLDFDEISVALRQTINRRAIESRRKELLMLHAAGLADPETGDVIALIGPSGAGKTTVASTLGTVLGYVSDETVAVDAAGRVHPFPKPLAIKQRHTLRKRIAGPDALGLMEVHTPLRLTRLALLDRREERVAPTVTTRGLEEVADLLIEQTSYFASLPRALQRLDALVRVSGGVHVIRYHHAADLVEPVSELLRRPAVHLSPVEVADVSGSAADSGTLLPGSYGRAEIDDWIEVGGEVLVLSDGRISRLSQLGSLLWMALRTPLPVEELVARAEAAFGPAPDDAARITVHMLDDLTAAGLVRVVNPDESLRDNARRDEMSLRRG
ncbi:PqqD family peptide modification chaperone [Leifsonia sp. McL0607]|uniref:PqqD family protein n=1 Tax=Leifsonia sp. McL0607 TaxID=3415672 RepID=UPI003CF627FC